MNEYFCWALVQVGYKERYLKVASESSSSERVASQLVAQHIVQVFYGVASPKVAGVVASCAHAPGAVVADEERNRIRAYGGVKVQDRRYRPLRGVNARGEGRVSVEETESS